MLIETVMYPVKLRFSAGYGEIYTPINSELSIGSDGPAWWAAREGMDFLKKNTDWGLKNQTNIRITRERPDAFFDLINETVSLCCAVKEKWKDEHLNIIKYIVENWGLKRYCSEKTCRRAGIAKMK